MSKTLQEKYLTRIVQVTLRANYKFTDSWGEVCGEVIDTRTICDRKWSRKFGIFSEEECLRIRLLNGMIIWAPLKLCKVDIMCRGYSI